MATRTTITTVLSLLLAGCVVDGTGEGNDPDTPPGDSDVAHLQLAFEGLDVLSDDFVYEGWIMVDGAPVTAGRFSVDEPAAELSFELDAADLDVATAYILTIEPAENDDLAPSAVHIVAGDIVDGMADLDTAHPAAIGTDFADAAGTYILETPTSADPDDYDQGIWWLTMPGPVATLDLPELPEGWTYEGWVVVDGMPISTGTFDYADEADSDGAGPDAGPDGAPPFPGQDFIDPALPLLGGLAVISVEPVPDTSAAPFAIKPLVDMEIEDAMSQGMDLNQASLPTGTASVHSMANM